MPKVHHVKKARKPIPDHGIAVGDSYYWWKNRRKGSKSGVKRISKKRPRPSQLTLSEYFSTAYSIQEGVEDIDADADPAGVADDLRAAADEIRSLGDDQRAKCDNMPDGLQQGDTGQLLENRADSCDSLADEVEQAADDIEEETADAKTEDKSDIVRHHLDSISWDFGA